MKIENWLAVSITELSYKLYVGLNRCKVFHLFGYPDTYGMIPTLNMGDF